VSELRTVNEGLRKRSSQITQLNEELLVVVASAVDARDPDVVNHSQSVSRYAQLIAKQMGIGARQLELVRKASLLHDLGKLGVPEAVLFKPGRLSKREYEIVKGHALLGAEILADSVSLRDVRPIVLHHHEHYDGGGYPDGLAGEAIPLESRILAVADAVEAMASDRPYRAAIHPAAIVQEIRDKSGTQFDPAVAAAFCTIVERHGLDVLVDFRRSPQRVQAVEVPA